jgi:hypothetical protein
VFVCFYFYTLCISTCLAVEVAAAFIKTKRYLAAYLCLDSNASSSTTAPPPELSNGFFIVIFLCVCCTAFLFFSTRMCFVLYALCCYLFCCLKLHLFIKQLLKPCCVFFKLFRLQCFLLRRHNSESESNDFSLCVSTRTRSVKLDKFQTAKPKAIFFSKNKV